MSAVARVGKTAGRAAGVARTGGEQQGGPTLAEARAWRRGRGGGVVPAGDHTRVVGRVLGGAVLREGEPLTQRALGWSYGG